MSLRDLMLKDREGILKAWFRMVADTYPPDARDFMLKEEDPFANPVGSSISSGLNALLDVLIADGDVETEEVCKFLDKVMRIRAVQDFTPAQAVGVVLMIKEVLREKLGDEVYKNGLFNELLAIESKIDRLVLLAFNIYMQCREKVFEMRATELRNRTHRIVERACQVWDSRAGVCEQSKND